MNDLERQYLVAAYELAKDDPVMHVFKEDDVTNHVDLDPSESDFTQRFISLTQYHPDRGFVAPFHKGGGTGRRALKITREGIEEAERLTDPIEQRKKLPERFLKLVYMQANGSPTEFVMWQNVAPELGLNPENQDHLDHVLTVADHLEHSDLISIEVNEGTMYTITAKGVDRVEGTEPQPQQNVSNTWNLSGNFNQSAIGTHNTNSFTGEFDFSTVEQRIEAEGGADKEELRELVAELRDLLENEGTINKGFLSRWNDKLKECDWLAGAVSGWLLNFATRSLGG